MRKNFIWVSLVTILGFFSSFSALSHDGTIRFRGTIDNAGCTISTKNVDVKFGKLSKNTFGTASNTVGVSKDFSISLTTCPRAETLGISFDGDPDTNNRNVYNSGVAGVGIQILKANDGTEIKPREHATGLATVTKGGNADMQFIAKLISTNNSVSEGAIDKSIGFTIIYP
ncbi:fimbrial protein [Photorhabdus stackebrandtii]|uniref:Type 1 fimbrial protein n=1 Tax=Photorhabdus stackebrandtii TaxID=1123042 RepID=A0A7X5QK85_9GAMM|nr:fimbrial protein [Photorhabdus stackebrandtii]NHB95816.1 type 1 fimbrial protein [Photorhabdus stackebrandtii]